MEVNQYYKLQIGEFTPRDNCSNSSQNEKEDWTTPSQKSPSMEDEQEEEEDTSQNGNNGSKSQS